MECTLKADVWTNLSDYNETVLICQREYKYGKRVKAELMFSKKATRLTVSATAGPVDVGAVLGFGSSGIVVLRFEYCMISNVELVKAAG